MNKTSSPALKGQPKFIKIATADIQAELKKGTTANLVEVGHSQSETIFLHVSGEIKSTHVTVSGNLPSGFVETITADTRLSYGIPKEA